MCHGGGGQGPGKLDERIDGLETSAIGLGKSQAVEKNAAHARIEQEAMRFLMALAPIARSTVGAIVCQSRRALRES
jgi:hypothetical protein